MKIYRNKLYSIQDAAKRAGIKEEDLKIMIKDNFIIPAHSIFIDCIKGKDIPGLKNKWIEYQKVAGAKKAKLIKKPIKVTMLKMDKGE